MRPTGLITVRRTVKVASLFLPWIALSYWTRIRWYVGTQPVVSHLDEAVAISSLALTLFLAVGAVVLNKGARLYFAYSGALNCYIAAIGMLLCIMATSGNWI